MRFLTPLLLGATSALLTAQAPQPVDPELPTAATAQQREQFIVAMKARLAINVRECDPFGLSQDLAASKPFGWHTPQPPTATLSDLISKMEIPLVDASARTFLMGSREFRTGEVFPLIYQGRSFRVRVESVTEDAIIFQDLKTGERAIRKNKLAPSDHIDFRDPPLPQGLEENNHPAGRPFHLPA